ncbi:MAG: zinc-dependent metalloprotease [Oligoflexia bacterium]|nr:zinc-dependent metalloprotease [Oligoflexia bacterium]
MVPIPPTAVTPQTTPMAPYQDWAISINKNSLKLPFLLMATEIQGAPLPIGVGLNNKIVYFERKGNSIYLFEYNNGKMFTTSLDNKILLTEFSIIEEDENRIHFDFKNGMDQIFHLDSIYLRSGAVIPNENIIKITKGFIKKIESKGEKLIVSESIRADFPSGYKKIIEDDSTDVNTPNIRNLAMEIKFAFIPYKPNAIFPIKEKNILSNLFNAFENFNPYFETNPKIDSDTGTINNLLIRQNIFNNNIITYYLKKDEIPAKYLGAIKDGINYWNKVFNKEIIKIEFYTNDSNIEIADPGYNIIKWINFSVGQFAYTNLSADPMTGEILNSTIYIPSSFASRSANIIESMLAQKSNLRDPRVRASIVSRFVLDSIRTIIAHEVGHTLGIRHNFAGNLSSNITHQNYSAILDDYLMNDNIPLDIKITSTVMDYLATNDYALIGALIRKYNSVLDYDKLVVNIGYLNNKEIIKEIIDNELSSIFYCGDFEVKDIFYSDCKANDRFAHPLSNIKYDLAEQTNNLAYDFLFNFSYLRNPSANDRTSAIAKTPFHPQSDANKLISIIANFLRIISEKSDFNFLKDDNLEESSIISNKRKNFLQIGLKDIDGFKSILFENFTPKINNKYSLPIVDIIRLKIKQGIEQSYKNNCKEKELQKLMGIFDSYTKVLEQELLFAFIQNLPSNSLTFTSEQDANDFYTGLGQFCEKILFAKHATPLAYSYFEYYFKSNLRKEIIKLLNFSFYPLNKSLQTSTIKRVQELFQNELTIKNEMLNDGRYSHEIKQKINDQILFDRELSSRL